MSKTTFDPKNVPSDILKGYIGEIQALHGYNKSISYKTIQKDLLALYGIEVELDRIEENYDPATKDLAEDTYLQYKNLKLT